MPMAIRTAMRMMGTLALAAALGHAAAADGPMGHVFGYRIAPGAQPQFEEGYRRHLQWHADHRDPLPWYGWYIVDGPRAGWFIDGTFGTAWDALDHRPAPAEDARDAQDTFLPHAAPVVRESWRRVDTAPATLLDPPTPQLRVLSYELKPGQGSRFDALCAQIARHLSPVEARGQAWFAPTSGTSLSRRIQWVAWRDGNDERRPPDLESRIDAQADPVLRARWREDYAASVLSVQAETWRYAPTLSRIP